MNSSHGTPEWKSALAKPPSLLFLIGYRGTGKTTVAGLLARRLGWDWSDLDLAIEATSGRAIVEIFASEGEAGFRRREAAALAEVCGRRRHVVATGGGIVLDPANRDALRRSGRTAWLTADPETIWRRLWADPATATRRPDLSVGGLAEVYQALQAREPMYRACADCVVATSGRSPGEVAGAIIEALGLERERGA